MYVYIYILIGEKMINHSNFEFPISRQSHHVIGIAAYVDAEKKA